MAGILRRGRERFLLSICSTSAVLCVLAGLAASSCTGGSSLEAPGTEAALGARETPAAVSTSPAPDAAAPPTAAAPDAPTAPAPDVPAALSGPREPPLGQLAIPADSQEAAALWREKKREALPALSRYFSDVDLDRDLQGHFDLLREIATVVPPASFDDGAQPDADAARVVTAIVGFLRLSGRESIRLPGEVFQPPWHVILELVVGLRTSAELGPPLLAIVREELEALEAGGGGAPRSPVPARLRNALYTIGYLRYRPAIGEVLRSARIAGAEDRLVVLDTVVRLGDRAGVPLLIEVLESSENLRELSVAAAGLPVLIDEAAEPHLVKLAKRDVAGAGRAAVGPLLSLSTPNSLAAVLELRRGSDGKRLGRSVGIQLARYAKALDLSRDDLVALIETSPGEAAKRIMPYAHRLEYISPDERRLSRDDLTAVLDLWRANGTIYTTEWSWVRDRHVVDAAGPEDLPRLEAVRVSILRKYRTTCVNEAGIIQRMYAAVQRK